MMQPPFIQSSSAPESVWETLVPERSPSAEGMFNASGAAVWELIDGRRALVQIAAEVARRYSHAMSIKRLIRFHGGER